MHAAARNFAKQAGAILGIDRDEIRTRGSVVVPPQTNRLAMVTFRIEPAFHRLRDRNSEYSETMHNCYSIRREGSYHLPRRIIALARGMRVRCSAGLVCILRVQHQREWDAARGRSTTPPPPVTASAARSAPINPAYTVTCGWLDVSIISPRCVITASIRPYSFASSAERKRSRSVSRSMRSNG